MKASSAVITSFSTTFWVMATASLEQFLICFGTGGETYVIRARIVDYIMATNNFDKLRSYIPQHYRSGEAYIQGEAMADLTTWATEVELFACAQLCGKDIVCYSHSRWLRYPASGNPRKPTSSAFFFAIKNGNHFNTVIRMQ